MKKRRKNFFFILGGILLVWVLAMQGGAFKMRTDDAALIARLQKRVPDIKARIEDIPYAAGKTAHGIVMSGADSLPLVLMVHGSPGSLDAYLDYLSDPVLLKNARMAAFDRPGFGFTQFGEPEISLEKQAAVLKALVDRLSPGRKVILVGHSMGAPVIARFAMDYPEQAGALLLVGGSIDPDMEEHPWWQRAVDVPPLRWFIPISFWASNREIKYLEQELRTMLPRWAEVRCPVIMFHATDDRLVPFGNVAFAERVLAHNPNFRKEIMDHGDHFIVWSEPAKMQALILELLKD
ncbi:MAG: alpha/beta hydrolase [Chitinophagales bacterium]|nr:alpha/beta hydrolase [Chitinophagales bacterium]